MGDVRDAREHGRREYYCTAMRRPTSVYKGHDCAIFIVFRSLWLLECEASRYTGVQSKIVRAANTQNIVHKCMYILFELRAPPGNIYIYVCIFE